jgi:hypothetical protein
LGSATAVRATRQRSADILVCRIAGFNLRPARFDQSFIFKNIPFDLRRQETLDAPARFQQSEFQPQMATVFLEPF